MAAENHPVATAAERVLTVTRVLDAPRELVWKAWTDPKQVERWWGPRGFTNPRCELDVRPGGAIHIDMRGPDGTIYPMVGTYREIAEPEKLVFVSSALDKEDQPLFEVLTTVTFAARGGKTTLTMEARVVKSTAAAAPHLAGMDTGWAQSLERLEVFAAGTADREIVFERVFDAPRELVWKAWTDPKQVVNWWGPNGFTTTIHEMDVRPGGIWKHTMHGPDGTDYPNKSVYGEVVKPERLTYSHGGARKGGPEANFHATVTFEAAGGKTKVTLRMVFASREDRDLVVEAYGAIEGGKQTLGRLAEYLLRIE